MEAIKWRIAKAEKELETTPQGGRDCPEPPRRGPKGASSGHHWPKTSPPGAHNPRATSTRRASRNFWDTPTSPSRLILTLTSFLERGIGPRGRWRMAYPDRQFLRTMRLYRARDTAKGQYHCISRRRRKNISLHFDHVAVQPACPQELFVCATLDDSARIEDQNLVHVLHPHEPVGDN
jgi:hypothetical protein